MGPFTRGTARVMTEAGQMGRAMGIDEGGLVGNTFGMGSKLAGGLGAVSDSLRGNKALGFGAMGLGAGALGLGAVHHFRGRGRSSGANGIQGRSSGGMM